MPGHCELDHARGRSQRGELFTSEGGFRRYPIALCGFRQDTHVRCAWVGSPATSATIAVISETSCFCPSRVSGRRRRQTCTRTVRAEPVAAVFTASAGIRWMYAAVLFRCVAAGVTTPSARRSAESHPLAANWRSRTDGKHIGRGGDVRSWHGKSLL